MQQFGLGLGVAVLIDATVIRSVLLPSTMKLLGDWYLPSWLERLPKVSVGEGGSAPAGRPPTVTVATGADSETIECGPRGFRGPGIVDCIIRCTQSKNAHSRMA